MFKGLGTATLQYVTARIQGYPKTAAVVAAVSGVVLGLILPF